MKPKPKTKKKLSKKSTLKKPKYDFIERSGILKPDPFLKALKEMQSKKSKNLQYDSIKGSGLMYQSYLFNALKELKSSKKK